MDDKPKPIKHRNLLKKFFITFPKSNVSKEEFTVQIGRLHEIKRGICVQEQHEDKTPHLHLGCEFKDGINKNNLLQKIINVYPKDYKRIDIQSMKSWESTIKYLTTPDKEKYVDQDPYLINCEIGVEKTIGQSYLHDMVKKNEFTIDEIIYYCQCRECMVLINKEFEIGKSFIRGLKKRWDDIYADRDIPEMEN